MRSLDTRATVFFLALWLELPGPPRRFVAGPFVTIDVACTICGMMCISALGRSKGFLGELRQFWIYGNIPLCTQNCNPRLDFHCLACCEPKDKWEMLCVTLIFSGTKEKPCTLQRLEWRSGIKITLILLLCK